MVGKQPAEFEEKRPSAKENPGQTTVTGTQSSEPALNGLDRIREAARRDKNLRFTNLLHHATEEHLEAAYRKLNPRAAKGVDKVAWWEYGVNL